jgi:hypothetical protein
VRTALDIVRDLVREEQTLAQRLEVVRAQLGALKQLAARRVHTSPPSARATSARPKKHARARRAPAPTSESPRRGRAARPRPGNECLLEPAPLPKPPTREARAKTVELAARRVGIRQVLAKARADEAAATVPAPPPPPTSSEPPPAKATFLEKVTARREQLHHIPRAARASNAAAIYRCACAGDAQLGQANNQAQAKLLCGALVFARKLRDHLVEHGVRAETDGQAMEYFDLVDDREREG